MAGGQGTKKVQTFCNSSARAARNWNLSRASCKSTLRALCLKAPASAARCSPAPTSSRATTVTRSRERGLAVEGPGWRRGAARPRLFKRRHRAPKLPFMRNRAACRSGGIRESLAAIGSESGTMLAPLWDSTCGRCSRAILPASTCRALAVRQSLTRDGHPTFRKLAGKSPQCSPLSFRT